MEKREFGRTGHLSSVAIFGGAAYWDVTQKQADETFRLVIDAGVNHIDVAPSYGKAEQLLGPWMKQVRDDFFLGCKTMERTKKLALAEANESLKRLQTDHFDLYQCHAVTTMEDLDKITMRSGAVEALEELYKSGLTQFFGITSHGNDAPSILLEALERFDFDSVLFPLNFILCADKTYRDTSLNLIQYCQENQIGMMVIKSIARGRWGDLKKTDTTWYQPFTDPEQIQVAIDFVLSHPVTGICMAGDVQLTPLILSACRDYAKMTEEDADKLIESGPALVHEPLFTGND